VIEECADIFGALLRRQAGSELHRTALIRRCPRVEMAQEEEAEALQPALAA